MVGRSDNMKNRMISSFSALVLTLCMATPVTSYAATVKDPEDLQVAPESHQDGSIKLPGIVESPEKTSAGILDIGTYGDGQWTRVATETVVLDTAGKSKTHSLNGDGVKVCFRTLEGSVKGGSFKVDLWEKDDASADDDYDGFNTEKFESYSSGTCAIYSGVGGDAGDEELYMTLYEGDYYTEKLN